jgi:flagellar hook-associated protein 1 FlgK
LKSDIVQSANVNVEKANNLFKEIATLNNEVTRAIAHDGVGAQTYVDQREKKLEELAQLFEITRTNGEYGEINVFINGMNIITGTTHTKLKLREKVDGLSGESSLQIVKVNNQNSETVIKMNEGEIGSMLKHYNETLNSFADSDTFSVMASLDNFVNALAKNVNNITVAGYGLNDITAPSQGRTFFEPSIGRATAATIQISQDVAGKPEDIPLSANPDEPGDSEIARKLSKLSINKNFLEGQTASEYYTNMLGQLGMKSKASQSGSDTTAIVSEQLNNQRESIIGVNLDEEAINLIKYQKSFEAASRVINATSTMLSTVINLGR